MKPWPAVLVCLLLNAPFLDGQSAEAQKGFRPLAAALHVHSRFSNGDYEILELASAAHQRKLDVLGFTDSFLTRVRYGVWPLRNFLSRTTSRSSVLDRGVEAYFDNLHQAQSQFPDVVMVPGLEVAPYYYWKGRWPSSLELHDFDRHVLVFGLEDSNVVRNLPVIENASWSNTERDWIRSAGPGVVCLGGVLLLSMFRVSKSRLHRVLGGVLLGSGLLWAAEAYPFSKLPDPYSGEHSDRPYQSLLTYVTDHGGFTFWSYPEAKYPEVQMSGARMISRGRPEILVQTDGYRGFEGLYGDRITITETGNLWDQLLLDYVRKGRHTWPSVISGIDFHSFRPENGWYQLDQGLTILFAKEKTTASVLDALKQGRGYSTFQQSPDQTLLLENFALQSAGKSAISGETLNAESDTVGLTANVVWRDANPSASGSTTHLRLIRDGKILEDYAGGLPLYIARHDTLEPGRHYYRLMVEYEHTRIVSNPIFCDILK